MKKSAQGMPWMAMERNWNFTCKIAYATINWKPSLFSPKALVLSKNFLDFIIAWWKEKPLAGKKKLKKKN